MHPLNMGVLKWELVVQETLHYLTVWPETALLSIYTVLTCCVFASTIFNVFEVFRGHSQVHRHQCLGFLLFFSFFFFSQDDTFWCKCSEALCGYSTILFRAGHITWPSWLWLLFSLPLSGQHSQPDHIVYNVGTMKAWNVYVCSGFMGSDRMQNASVALWTATENDRF